MRINLDKHMLVKVWMKKKKEIDQQIIKENITTDEQIEHYINQLFAEIGPLWFRAFRFDHPDQEYNHWNLKWWLEENETDCRQRSKSKEALASKAVAFARIKGRKEAAQWRCFLFCCFFMPIPPFSM